jgi:hypothetical protein
MVCFTRGFGVRGWNWKGVEWDGMGWDGTGWGYSRVGIILWGIIIRSSFETSHSPVREGGRKREKGEMQSVTTSASQPQLLFLIMGEMVTERHFMVFSFPGGVAGTRPA